MYRHKNKNTQQKLANESVKAIVEQAYQNIFFVDGSSNCTDARNYNKRSQDGLSCCQSMVISKEENTQTPHTFFSEKVNANDPQLAELQGFLRALQVAEHTHNETQKCQFSMPYDSKGVARCISHQYSLPCHYSKHVKKCRNEKHNFQEKV